MSSVLITRRLPGASVARLAAHHEVDLHAGESPLSTEELHERLEGKAGVVVLLRGRIDRAAIDAAGPSLKIIANVAVGYDNLDVAYAVVEGHRLHQHSRRAHRRDRRSHLGADPRHHAPARRGRAAGCARARGRAGASTSCSAAAWPGKLLGIVGGGPHRPGRGARAAAAFGMRVAVSSRRDPQWPGVEFMPFDRLISSADVVSLHVPLTPETRHLIDRTALTRMKRSAYLINTTRGPVVDEGGAGVGAEGAPHRRRRARRLRARARGASRPARASRTCCCRRTSGSATRETRTAMADLAIRQRARRAERPAAADAHRVAMPSTHDVRNPRNRTRSPIRDRRQSPEPPSGLSCGLLARAIDGLELPAVEKICRIARRVFISRSVDCHAAVGAHAGCHDSMRRRNGCSSGLRTPRRRCPGSPCRRIEAARSIR